MNNNGTPWIGRALAAAGIATGLLIAAAPAAFAHSEFDLDEAAPGSIVTLHLSVENESSTAGTTQVELRFPEPLVVVDLPTVEGWTATPVEGVIGSESIGVLWTRPTADPTEDPSLPLTIGPLPDAEGRLQFKVLQTYSDGEEDAWINDWPVGAEEPDHPGPVIDLVAGAPGTIPDTTAATATTVPDAIATVPASEPAASTTDAATTTPATTNPATTAPETVPASVDASPPTELVTTDTADGTDGTDEVDEADDADDSNTVVIVVVTLAVLAAVAAGVAWSRRSSR